MPGMTCWEHMNCKKESQCPAHPIRGFECWNVQGTLCRDQLQGSYHDKIEECRTKCDYYIGVMSGTIRVT
jgi:methyl-accepting chemotaxis protein